MLRVSKKRVSLYQQQRGTLSQQQTAKRPNLKGSTMETATKNKVANVALIVTVCILGLGVFFTNMIDVNTANAANAELVETANFYRAMAHANATNADYCFLFGGFIAFFAVVTKFVVWGEQA